MSNDCEFSRDLGDRLKDVARMYVGVGKRFSAAVLADSSGIPVSTLKTYLSGETAIPAHNLLRLLTVLPVEAGNLLIGRTGFKLAPVDPEEDDWDAIGAEASMLTFEIFDAKSDGVIDHRERAKLKSRCRSLVAKLDGASQ